MCRVFVFEETHLDISGLKRYGEILYVFYSEEVRRPIKDEQLDDQIISQLSRFLYDPEEDYIAIVGQIVPISILISAAVATYGKIRTLFFDARTQEYCRRSMGSVPVKAKG